MPLQLLIGVAEEVGRQIELRGHVGAGRRLNQRADVCDQSGVPTIDELANFGQVAVETERRHRGKLQKLALRQSQRSAKFSVIVVAGGVEWDQHVIRVVAPKKEYADQRLIGGRRRRGLSKGVERAKGPEPGKTAPRGKRGVFD